MNGTLKVWNDFIVLNVMGFEYLVDARVERTGLSKLLREFNIKVKKAGPNNSNVRYEKDDFFVRHQDVYNRG